MSDTKKTGANRRDFLKVSGVGAAGAAALAAGLGSGSVPAYANGGYLTPAPLPAKKGPRLVVIGGGASGLTVAKFAKQANPKLDVVLVEPRAIYMSCFISNQWMTGIVDQGFISNSFVTAAKNGNYLWFQAALVDLDRDKKRATTTEGYIDYDFIHLAPGIQYNYDSIGVKDPADVYTMMQNYTPGMMTASEHMNLKQQLEDFEGGIWIQTVPTGNYRCLPAPYERACLVADYFKRNKIKGKVIVCDPRDKPSIKAEGFLAGFEYHKDHLEYQPSVEITSVDIPNKTLKSDFGDVKFDAGAIYPRCRAHRMIEDFGLVQKGNPQMEADIDPYNYNVKGDETCTVGGDARPMPFSKSGNTANTEGHIIANIIAARSMGKPVPKWTSPQTICYSMIKSHPNESIMVDAKYKSDGKGGGWGFTDVKVTHKWTEAQGAANLEWAKGLYADFFEE